MCFDLLRIMSEVLYMDDSYLKEFDAKVVSVKDKFVVLDRTAFYPRGGGQQHDTGKIIRDGEEFEVVFVGKFNGEVSHEVDKEGLKEGDSVHCVLNWERRYKLMRMHTMAHVLSKILEDKFDVMITGNELGEEKTRIDFSLEKYDPEVLKTAVDEANALIENGAEVKIHYLPREEAIKIENITRLAKGLPDVQEFRIVEIEGIDYSADGGTHVKNITEIGKVEFLKAENKGKSRRRIYVKLLD
jgi:Ser-tRNA(Ala) deacylase AlaX